VIFVVMVGALWGRGRDRLGTRPEHDFNPVLSTETSFFRDLCWIRPKKIAPDR
jgi:hypothetical protein